MNELKGFEPVKLDHIACIDDGELRYMSGRKAPDHDCELYAMPDGHAAPTLYTADQLAAVVQQRDELLAASERAIEALQWNHDQGHKTDMTDEPRKRDARALRALRSAIANVKP